MFHSISHEEPMDKKHSINLCNHERYLVHLKCLRNIKKIKYPDFQAMTRVHSNNTRTELIALTETNYVPLRQVQISLCAKIGYMYYCEYAHLLRKCTEHTCMSAIYYDQGSTSKLNDVKLLSHSILFRSLKY